MPQALKICLISLAAVIAVFGIIAASVCAVAAVANRKYTFAEYSVENTAPNKIHFLNTGYSDAILIESEGHFALIDCAEDSDNPRGFPSLEIAGHEQHVLDYVTAVAGVEGQVHLDFVLGTHAHSDHIGGFDTLLSAPHVTVDTVYLKRYYEERTSEYEVKEWDNQQVYDQMLAAANSRGFTVVQDLVGVQLRLGAFDVEFYNTEEPTPNVLVGENDNSVAVLVTGFGHKILLAGDMNNSSGDEVRVAKQIGHVDVLKLGHHGLRYSSTARFMSIVSPDIAIRTATGKPNFFVWLNTTALARAPIYTTDDKRGIVLVVDDELQLFEHSDDIVKTDEN